MTSELTNNADKLLRKREAAEMLACSQRHVDRLAVAGKLTRIKILGAVRFRLSQVQSLINGGSHDLQS